MFRPGQWLVKSTTENESKASIDFRNDSYLNIFVTFSNYKSFTFNIVSHPQLQTHQTLIRQAGSHNRKVQLQLQLLSYDRCFFMLDGCHCFAVTKTKDNKDHYDCLGN